MDQDIAFASAKKLAARIRRRDIGCLELLDLYLARINKHNSKLNAIVVTRIEIARKRAKALDRSIRNGKTLGPLHGVPMTVKESFDVEGLATTWGMPSHISNVATRSALAVERLECAGANIFGKTNVPVMLSDWQTFNPIYGTTNNPWDVTRTPGGSSGGAAAALAAGLTGLEIGSDIGGSIRNPAHYCGVYGHKPTFGLCAPDGQNLPGIMSHKDIAVVGPMARNAEDLALALDILAGPNDVHGRAWQVNLPKCKKTQLKDFRIGVLLSVPTAEVDTGVQEVLSDLARALAIEGAKVTGQPPAIDMSAAHRIFIQLLRSATSTSLSHATFEKACKAARSADLSTEDYAQWMVLAQSMSHRDWQSWHEHRLRIGAAWEAYFREYDVLICPAAATTAFPHDQKQERWQRMIFVNGRPQPSTTQMFWAGLSGMAYLPSTVAPAGIAADGMPVGIQIVAAQYADHTAIAFAGAMAKAFGGFKPPLAYC